MSEKFKEAWEKSRGLLNQAQREAADTLDGPVRVKAGPGTGKTHMTISRLVHMVASDINPGNILMLTFTNKAADEMKQRAEKVLGCSLDGLTACTFHSFCVKFLKEFAYLLKGYDRNFMIADTSECINILDYQKALLYPDEKKFPTMGEILNAKSMSVNLLVPIEAALKENKKTAPFIAQSMNILNEFEKYKKEQNLMDFNDLLLNTLKLLQTSKIASDTVNKKFLYKMVDEFQDTNQLQMKIVKELCKGTNNICVVGDLLQQLYKFNGADNKIMLNFTKEFPGTKDIFLNENYRSSKEIVGTFNSVSQLAETGEQILNGQFSEGVSPIVVRPLNTRSQTDYIINSIKEDLAKGVKGSEIAVLFRTAMECAEIEQIFTKERIPFEKFGGPKFFEQKFIVDLFSWLKVLNNPWHIVAWFRILKLYQGIADVNARKICDEIKTYGIGGLISKKFSGYSYYSGLVEIYNIFSTLSKMSDFQEQLIYLENYYFEHWELMLENSKMNANEKEKSFAELSRAKNNLDLFNECAAPYPSSLSFLNDYTLSPNVNVKEEDKIVLSTIHSSKGLEWDKVYIMNASENIFPSSKTIDTFQDELCCFYVAASRPRKELVIVSPEDVTKFGRTVYGCGITPYLDESMEHEVIFI